MYVFRNDGIRAGEKIFGSRLTQKKLKKEDQTLADISIQNDIKPILFYYKVHVDKN